jgi:hypothetical protein
MSWLSFANLALATVAISLSFFTLRAGRQQQRYNAYVRAEEFLLAPDQQAGRSKIYAAERAGRLPADDGDFDAILRAFGGFNTVARLARRGALPRVWLLEEWHHHLRGMRVVFDSVLAQRALWHQFHPWVELDDLISDATSFVSTRACCHGPSLAELAARREGRLLPRP